MLTGYLSLKRRRLHGKLWLSSLLPYLVPPCLRVRNASCIFSELKGEYDLFRKWIGLIYQNVKNLQIKYFLKLTESDFHLSNRDSEVLI